MSRIGDVVVGRTSAELYAAARDARSKLMCGLTGRLAVSMPWLIEKRVQPIYRVDVDVVADSDAVLEGAHAAYVPGDRVLRIRESVFRQAASDDKEAVFTICHEIGHICLHSSQEYFRREQPRHLPKKICDPEWQADRFAIEFSLDREMIGEFGDTESLSNYFRIPKQKLQIYLAEMKAEGRLSPNKRRGGCGDVDYFQADLDL